MLRSLEDFSRLLYAGSAPAKQRRCYHQLLRLCRARSLRTHYLAFSIPKRGGGSRPILAPDPALKYIQRGIHRLLSDAALPACATAYRPGRSVRDNALPHAGQSLILRLDLKDFFGSVRFLPVYRAIDRALAASSRFGRHCLNAFDRSELGGRSYNQALSFCFARLCTLDGVLPQGSPASPLLSNLVFAPIDRILSDYCTRRGIVYTRYSDDLTFSGAFRPFALLGFVTRLLEQNGFELNPSKTALLGTGDRHRITGAVVNGGGTRAARDYKRGIRQELYYIQRFGVESHLLHRLNAERLPECEPERALRGLLGRIGFVLHLDPDDAEFRRYRSVCQTLLAPAAGPDAAP